MNVTKDDVYEVVKETGLCVVNGLKNQAFPGEDPQHIQNLVNELKFEKKLKKVGSMYGEIVECIK